MPYDFPIRCIWYNAAMFRERGVTAPTGNTQAFASQGGWTGRPRLVFEWRLPHDAFGGNRW